MFAIAVTVLFNLKIYAVSMSNQKLIRYSRDFVITAIVMIEFNCMWFKSSLHKIVDLSASCVKNL